MMTDGEVGDEVPKEVGEYRRGAANEIGHLALVLASTVCALTLKGIPVWIWIVLYVFTAIVASILWREIPDSTTSPVSLLSAVAFFGGISITMYLVEGSFIDPGQPWMAFRSFAFTIPALALLFLAELARTLYMRHLS